MNMSKDSERDCKNGVLSYYGMDFGVAKGRLVTQSCSLFCMAHKLTGHGWNTHHDQHAARGSQNKLLTKVSLRSDTCQCNHSEVSGLERKVIQSHTACWQN